ncbi:hypothetical protein B0H10DRAFT_1943350 [Mycena sp. CBHHK59/15]|nr:hypothetical protein B0H10DRAFT_1943350 [Mycena sp. CBHHK59/15]
MEKHPHGQQGIPAQPKANLLALDADSPDTSFTATPQAQVPFAKPSAASPGSSPQASFATSLQVSFAKPLPPPTESYCFHPSAQPTEFILEQVSDVPDADWGSHSPAHPLYNALPPVLQDYVTDGPPQDLRTHCDYMVKPSKNCRARTAGDDDSSFTTTVTAWSPHSQTTV